jgi:hypothetical protein
VGSEDRFKASPVRSDWLEVAPAILALKSPPGRETQDRILLSACGLVVTTCLALITVTLLNGMNIGALIIEAVLLATFLVVLRSCLSFKGRSTEADEAMMESPEDAQSLLVEVEIWQRGGLTGVDRGVIWIEGSRLIFSGHRSSFALAPAAFKSSTLSQRLQLGLYLVTPGSVHIRASKLQRLDLHDQRHGPRILKSISDFVKTKRETAELEQLPPLTLDTTVSSARVFWYLVPLLSSSALALVCWLAPYLLLDGVRSEFAIPSLFPPFFVIAGAAIFLACWRTVVALRSHSDFVRSLVVRRQMSRGTLSTNRN